MVDEYENRVMKSQAEWTVQIPLWSMNTPESPAGMIGNN